VKIETDLFSTLRGGAKYNLPPSSDADAWELFCALAAGENQIPEEAYQAVQRLMIICAGPATGLDFQIHGRWHKAADVLHGQIICIAEHYCDKTSITKDCLVNFVNIMRWA
jgi:hypothetical protein